MLKKIIKQKMVVFGVSIGREIQFVRNNLKWFSNFFTHLHFKNMCLVVSSHEWRRVAFVLQNVKCILFRYNIIWSILYRKLRWKLFIETIHGNVKKFSSYPNFHFEKLCHIFWEVAVLSGDRCDTDYVYLMFV